MNLQTSPSLNTALGSLDIIISLSTQLSDRTEFAAICIKNAIASNMPSQTILVTVKDMIMDNPEAMIAILGGKLTDKILEL